SCFRYRQNCVRRRDPDFLQKLRKACIGPEGAKLGKKRDPLQYSRMFCRSAFEPAERFFFFAERDVNRRNRLSRDVARSSFLHELLENFPRFILTAHPRVGNGKAATWEMRRVLSFRIEGNRFRKVSLLAIRCGESRIQIKVMGIELLSSLSLGDCLIDSIFRQVSGSGDVANNW